MTGWHPERGTAPSGLRLPAPGWWREALERSGRRAGFCQTTTWAAVAGIASGGISQVVTSPVPDDHVGALVTVYAGHDLRARLRGRSAVVIDGPVLGEGDPGPALARLLPDLETASRRMRARSLTLVPPTGAGWADQPEARALLDSRGYRCDEWMTAVVDLARTPDELFGAFRRSARKAVRRAEELGVRIVRCADIEEYANRFRPAYREGRRAMGLGLPPEKDVAAMADLIGTTYHFFLAVDGSDGRTLATLGTYRFCGMATEVASVQTNEGRERGYPAQDLLHWEAMRFHCSLGDQAFDLAGYNPAPTSEKEAGIARFKQKWGGTPVSTPRFHLRLPRRVRA